MAWALPRCSSSRQHNQISNPFGIHGSEIDVVHPPGVPFYSQPMQQNHDIIYHPYGYHPSSVPGFHQGDPNSIRPVQILEHKQHSGSSNSVFPHFGYFHPQQNIDTHGQASYLYSGRALTSWPLPAYAPPTKVRQQKAPRVLAWCELCRVDCVTLDSLEKHKQGKKHKKHMKVLDDMQNNKKALTGSADNTTLPSQPFIPQLQSAEKVGEEEEEEKVPVVLNEVQKQPESSKKEGTDYNGTQPSFKKKVKKRKKNNTELKVATEQPNVTLWECKMCNITCNSQVVFDTHLTGRRHLTNLVRLHGRHSTVSIFNGGEAAAQNPVAIGNIHGEDAMRVGNSNSSWVYSSKRGMNKFKRYKQVKPKAVVASNCDTSSINHINTSHSEIQTTQQLPVTLSSTETPEKEEEEHPTKAQRMETDSPSIEPTPAQSLDQEESHPSSNEKTDIKEGLKTYHTSVCIASDNSSLSPFPSSPEVPADEGSKAVEPMINP